VSPSGRRVLPFIALTLVYWPVALFVIGVSQMGDCYVDEPACEHGKAIAFWRVLGVEAAVFAALLYGLAKLFRR
jgi:hypothetical protein